MSNRENYFGQDFTKFKTRDPKVTRGIAFGGCSFTWGQGLYYYSNLPTIKEPMPNHFARWLVKSAHISFMESVRYPRLVAKHFNTFEEVHPYNGGSDESAIDFWTRTFDPTRDGVRHMNDDGTYSVSDPNYDYKEFAYFVYQFTQPERSRFKFTYQGKQYHFVVHYARNQSAPVVAASGGTGNVVDDFSAFKGWLLENNMTYEQWEDLHRKNVVADVKTMLMNFETHGVKTRILVWPNEMVNYVLADPWMKERFVTLYYKDMPVQSFAVLMDLPEMKIDTDHQHFITTPGDHHPSLLCHQAVAESLIRTMDENYIHRPHYE